MSDDKANASRNKHKEHNLCIIHTDNAQRYDDRLMCSPVSAVGIFTPFISQRLSRNAYLMLIKWSACDPFCDACTRDDERKQLSIPLSDACLLVLCIEADLVIDRRREHTRRERPEYSTYAAHGQSTVEQQNESVCTDIWCWAEEEEDDEEEEGNSCVSGYVRGWCVQQTKRMMGTKGEGEKYIVGCGEQPKICYVRCTYECIDCADLEKNPVRIRTGRCAGISTMWDFVVVRCRLVCLCIVHSLCTVLFFRNHFFSSCALSLTLRAAASVCTKKNKTNSVCTAVAELMVHNAYIHVASCVAQSVRDVIIANDKMQAYMICLSLRTLLPLASSVLVDDRNKEPKRARDQNEKHTCNIFRFALERGMNKNRPIQLDKW